MSKSFHPATNDIDIENDISNLFDECEQRHEMVHEPMFNDEGGSISTDFSTLSENMIEMSVTIQHPVKFKEYEYGKVEHMVKVKIPTDYDIEKIKELEETAREFVINLNEVAIEEVLSKTNTKFSDFNM